MNELMNFLKGAAPALATAVGGPLGGMAMNAIAAKLGVEATEVHHSRSRSPVLVDDGLGR